MRIKYIFRLLILLILFACNENTSLKDKLVTKENEFWIIDDFSEVGHLYGFKFEKNSIYNYYLIVETNKTFRKFDKNAQGSFTIKEDSIIKYYFEGKIITLKQDSCKIKLGNGHIQTLVKKKFNNYKQT